MGTNYPTRADYDAVREYIEFRVVGMHGNPRVSGTYSTHDLGPDAFTYAQAAYEARGGKIEMRTIKVSDWTTYAPEHDHGRT